MANAPIPTLNPATPTSRTASGLLKASKRKVPFMIVPSATLTSHQVTTDPTRISRGRI